MIDPISIGIGIGAFLIGHVSHKHKNNTMTLQTLETMLEHNKELSPLALAIDFLNKDIENKNSFISELEEEVSHQQENINRLLKRAEYIRNSGELEKLEALAQTTKNLNHLKQILSKFQKKEEERFNMGVLIALVQDLYREIYGIDLNVSGVESLMMEFTDSSEGSGTTGGRNNKQIVPPSVHRTEV